MKRISIIIVTYNSFKLIEDCLSSIYKFNDIGESLEVIIVDNHSDDQNRLFEFIKGKYGDKVLLIDSGRNCGYGTGNNIGVMHSTADIIVVMNPDIRLVAPIFQKIIYSMNKPNNGLLGVDFVDGSSPYYFKRDYSTIYNELFFKYYVWKRKFDSKKMFLSGSFLVFNKKAFIHAGKFDENIFMYSEEADISNRIMQCGYVVKWCPNIKVLHLAHGREFNKKMDTIRLESGLYYERKFGVDSKKVYRNSVIILYIKIVVSLLTCNKRKYHHFKHTLCNLREFYERSLNNL